EMFSHENAHHIPSLPAKKIPYPISYPQPSSLQAKAKEADVKGEIEYEEVQLQEGNRIEIQRI
ncbi:hypothetical protein Tco_1421811, partial [Tanacetum coccineum]